MNYIIMWVFSGWFGMVQCFFFNTLVKMDSLCEPFLFYRYEICLRNSYVLQFIFTVLLKQIQVIVRSCLVNLNTFMYMSPKWDNDVFVDYTENTYMCGTIQIFRNSTNRTLHSNLPYCGRTRQFPFSFLVWIQYEISIIVGLLTYTLKLYAMLGVHDQCMNEILLIKTFVTKHSMIEARELIVRFKHKKHRIASRIK
jgi:hypothetical protein